MGYKSTYDNGFGTTTYQKSERILFGKDKGTKTKTTTKVYGSTKLTKTDKTYKDGTKEKSETYSVGGIKNSTINKKFADGSKSEIKSKSFGDDSAFSLFSVKSQTEVITDKNGNKTMKESKSYGVFGYRWGRTTARTADGRLIETTWKGVETVNWRGEKVLKIKSSESREVQSTRAKLSLTKDGRVVMTKGAFSVVLPKKGEGGPVRSMPNAIPSKEKIFVVDEASMMGSRQALEVFKAAEKAGGRVIMVGDVKQLLGVQAGKVFSDAQKFGVVDVTKMNEVLRQKTEDYKAVVSDVTAKRMDKAFDRLEKGGNLHQIADRGERINALVKDYTSGKNWKENIIVTTRNADRQEINKAIREELKSQGKIGQKDHSLNVRTPKSISTVNRHFAQSYKEGDYVFSSKSGEGLRAGDEAKIVNIDPKNHTLTLEKRTGEAVEFDLKNGGKDLSVYSAEQKEFSTGEKIVFLKNSQKMGVQNGMTGIIKDINQHGKLTVETEAGKEISFNVKQYGYFDSGYAVTDYKSQGQTSEKVIFHADTNEGGNNFNSFYVAATRGKNEMQLYTDDADRLKTQVSEEQTKKSALDYQEKNGIDSEKELNKTDDKSISKVKEEKSEIDKIKLDLSEKFESSLKDTDRGEKGIERDKSSMKENTDSGKGSREMEKSESSTSSAKTQDIGMEM